MKFINKYTKAVLETDKEFVIEQMKKSDKYEELKVVSKPVVVEKTIEITEDKSKKKKSDKEDI